MDCPEHVVLDYRAVNAEPRWRLRIPWRWVSCAVLLAIAALALAYEVEYRIERRRYLQRFDRTALIGLTTSQVRARLGSPTDQPCSLGPDGGDTTFWLYGGSELDATIAFRGDRVVGLARHRHRDARP